MNIEILESDLRKLCRQIHMGDWSSGYRINPTQRRILELLREHRGEPTNSELSELLLVKPATMSDSLKALVNRGLVSRIRYPNNNKENRIRLTVRGHQQLFSLPNKLQALLKTLQPQEQRRLRALILKLLRSTTYTS